MALAIVHCLDSVTGFLLRSLGLGDSSVPEGVRPNVHGQSGFPLRWGEGWLEEVRETVGWGIARKDQAATQFRVELLLKMWSQKKTFWPLV